MENKKSKKADLEGKRIFFLEIGFVVALGFLLIAFEWTSKPTMLKGFSKDQNAEIIQENIPITRQEQKKLPPPPPPPKVSEVINIVENNVNIEDELILDETEADQDTKVQIDAFSQEEEAVSDDLDEIFLRVEDMPKFNGQGINEFRNYIQKNLIYPAIAADNGIQGTVYVKFIVDKDGSISEIIILRGVDPALDQAAIEAIKSAPKWEPGKQRGKPVRVSLTMPIAFVLE